MASIENRNGSFRVLIRRKNNEISKTFNDRSTAELWAKYKEDLINEMHAFDIPQKDLITIRSIVELKQKELISKCASEIRDIVNIVSDFEEIIDKYVSEVSYDDYLGICNSMLKKIVLRGGNVSKGLGLKTIQSPVTVLRKFRVLASAYSYAIAQGIQIDNIPSKVIPFIKNIIKNSGESD